MVKFFLFTLKHPAKPDEIYNYRNWVTLNISEKKARLEAVKKFPGYKLITYSYFDWWQIIYALPVFNKDLNDHNNNPNI